MSNPFRTYSDILALRTAAIEECLPKRDAARALKLLVIVGLIAGLGIFGGIPAALSTPTVTERIDMGISTMRDATASTVAAVLPVLTNAQSVTQTAVDLVEQQVTGFRAQVQGLVDGLTGAISTGQAQVAQVTQSAQAQALLQQATVTKAQVEQVVSQGGVSREQLTALLARANLSAEQANEVMQEAGVAQADMQQVWADVQAQVKAGASAVASEASAAAMTQLQPLLESWGIGEAQFNDILAQLATTPEQFNQLLKNLSLTPQMVGSLIKQVEATPEQLNQLAAQVREESVKAEPVIGARPSRIVHLVGQWITAPLQLASDWLLFALVLLVVAKLLGGRATLPRHLGAMALASAPLVLLIGLYLPDLGSTLSAPLAGAIHYFTRLLALIGLAWGGLLLLRTLSLAHQITPWRALGALALAWLGLYVALPLVSLLATGFLLQ